MDARLTALVQTFRPTDRPWSPGSLRHLVEAIGGRPELWSAVEAPAAGSRTYQLAYRDDLVEVWFIAWPRDVSTEMHDHGGSAGAMSILDGALAEDRVVPGGVHQRVLRSGHSTSFTATYIHDVRNQMPHPAISVNAYSPPIAQMTYYDMTTGVPVAVRTEAVHEGVPA
jgi:hypothetical protein